jgi:replicative DNA helicase
MAYEFSENVQRGILFLSKFNRDFFSQIAPLVKAEYFEYPVHGAIYTALNSYFQKYSKLPSDDYLLEQCRALKKPKEDFSGYEDEITLINKMDTSSMEHVDFFMDIIEDFAKKESMKSAIMASIEHIQEDNYSMVEEEIRKALTVSRNMSLGQIYFDDVTNRWIRNVERRNEAKYRTVFKTLNKELDGGLSAKELAMVVAPPGVGKSLYLVNQGVQALMEERKVLYISLEMSEDKIAQRFDSVISQIGQGYLEHKQGDLLKRLSIFKKNFVDSNLVIKEYPTGLAKVSDIRALLSQLRNFEAFEPDLIIVDYLELLGSDRDAPEYQLQEHLARELRGLAVEQGILVWTATQTNRQGSNVNIITDSELGDSYGKFRTVDYCISLNQGAEEFDEGMMRAYVMKSRNGRTRFQVPVSIDYNTLTMQEAERPFSMESDD